MDDLGAIDVSGRFDPGLALRAGHRVVPLQTRLPGRMFARPRQKSPTRCDATASWCRRPTWSAQAEGADDKAIHDTVLIAAAFCMFNRYVEGIGTWAPEDPAAYVDSGVRLAEDGYARFDLGKIRAEWPKEG
jgi:hypothetical protein